MARTTDISNELAAFLGQRLAMNTRYMKGGYPFDITDGDEECIELTAVDADAAKGLAQVMRKAGFKVTRYELCIVSVELK